MNIQFIYRGNHSLQLGAHQVWSAVSPRGHRGAVRTARQQLRRYIVIALAYIVIALAPGHLGYSTVSAQPLAAQLGAR